MEEVRAGWCRRARGLGLFNVCSQHEVTSAVGVLPRSQVVYSTYFGLPLSGMVTQLT
jgi:hypothetical protein